MYEDAHLEAAYEDRFEYEPEDNWDEVDYCEECESQNCECLDESE